MPRTQRFNLSSAQHRLLEAAADAWPSPCTLARAKYRRGVEVLASLGLVTGSLGGFTATRAGLQELGRAVATTTVPAAALEGVAPGELERLVRQDLAPTLEAVQEAYSRRMLEGHPTGGRSPLGITSGHVDRLEVPTGLRGLYETGPHAGPALEPAGCTTCWGDTYLWEPVPAPYRNIGVNLWRAPCPACQGGGL